MELSPLNRKWEASKSLKSLRKQGRVRGIKHSTITVFPSAGPGVWHYYCLVSSASTYMYIQTDTEDVSMEFCARYRMEATTTTTDISTRVYSLQLSLLFLFYSKFSSNDVTSILNSIDGQIEWICPWNRFSTLIHRKLPRTFNNMKIKHPSEI